MPHQLKIFNEESPLSETPAEMWRMEPPKKSAAWKSGTGFKYGHLKRYLR